MARKETIVTITAEGRDKGKAFLITELPASEAEEWAMRAMFSLMNAGVEIPENIAEAGTAGLFALGLTTMSKLPFEAARPLFDKMMECVQIKLAVPRSLIESDIEEVLTRLTLRKAVWDLHTDFFIGAAPSISASTSSQVSG